MIFFKVQLFAQHIGNWWKIKDAAGKKKNERNDHKQISSNRE